MPYLTGLEWMKNLDEFSDEGQKVMLALSHDKYRRRSRDRLLEATRLNTKRLEHTLAHLITDALLSPAFSNKRNIIFGLRERAN